MLQGGLRLLLLRPLRKLASWEYLYAKMCHFKSSICALYSLGYEIDYQESMQSKQFDGSRDILTSLFKGCRPD